MGTTFSQAQFQDDLIARLYRYWVSTSRNSAATSAQAKRRAADALLALGYSREQACRVVCDAEEMLDLRLRAEGLR
jgi:Holliday junction resolvasome RuvABC DNA-binding subunit